MLTCPRFHERSFDRFHSLSAEETIKWHAAKPPKLLGQGTFGRVYEAIDDETGEIIAVKEIGTHSSRAKSIAALQKEMETLRLLRHANIIQYKGVEHHPQEESIVFLMEVCFECVFYVLSGSFYFPQSLFAPSIPRCSITSSCFAPKANVFSSMHLLNWH